MALPLRLNLYGINMVDFVFVYTVLDMLLVVTNLRILEPDLPYIGPIILGP